MVGEEALRGRDRGRGREDERHAATSAVTAAVAELSVEQEVAATAAIPAVVRATQRRLWQSLLHTSRSSCAGSLSHLHIERFAFAINFDVPLNRVDDCTGAERSNSSQPEDQTASVRAQHPSHRRRRVSDVGRMRTEISML